MLFKSKDLVGLSILCFGLLLATASSQQKKQMHQIQIANYQELGMPFLNSLPPKPFQQKIENFVLEQKEPSPVTISLKADQLIKLTQVKN